MRRVGEAIMHAMALGLGLDEHFFDSRMDDSFWVMRLIGYPPLDPAADGVGISCGEHTDYGCPTILNTDETTGALQVKSKTGEWTTAYPTLCLPKLLPPAVFGQLGPRCCKWSSADIPEPTVLQALAKQPVPPSIQVTCDGGAITELYIDGLSPFKLKGTLNDAGFPGPLSTLRLLVLTNHPNLSGAIPDAFVKFTQLQYLDLSSNSHAGLLPPSLASATVLRHLDLSQNMISGDIPWDIAASFPTLSYLNLAGTFVSDTMQDLTRMQGLSSCNFTGSYVCVPAKIKYGAVCTVGAKNCFGEREAAACSMDVVEG
nr:hypothetical protein HK105_001851 [Polyrhizophydium stewartii]